MMMVVAMFAMTACDTLPTDGGKDDDNAPSAKTIGEINYKPADSDAVSFQGLEYFNEKYYGLAGVKFADDTLTNDDIVQMVVAEVEKTEGIASVTLDGYTADTAKPAFGSDKITGDFGDFFFSVKKFPITLKIVAKEGYKFDGNKNELSIPVDLLIGKKPETDVVTANLLSIYTGIQSCGDLNSEKFCQLFISGVDIDSPIFSGSTALHMTAITLNNENYCDYFTVLLGLGADTEIEAMGATPILGLLGSSYKSFDSTEERTRILKAFKSLVGAGADVNAVSTATYVVDEGKSALDCMLQYGRRTQDYAEYISILEEKGATAPWTQTYFDKIKGESGTSDVGGMGICPIRFSVDGKTLTMVIMATDYDFEFDGLTDDGKAIYCFDAYTLNPNQGYTIDDIEYYGVEPIAATTGKFYFGKGTMKLLGLSGMGDMSLTPRDKVFAGTDAGGPSAYDYTLTAK